MPAEAQLMVGPMGPDTIAIPGDPQRLRSALESLRDLCRQLDDVGKQLRHADAPEGKRGRTVRSLSNVAGRTGRVLQADSDKLQQLCDAVQHQAELLSDAQGNLDDLRRQWRQARQQLRDVVQGEETKRAARSTDKAQGDGGRRDDDNPVDASAIIHDIDADVAHQHENTIQRLSGVNFGGFGGGGGKQAHAMLVDGELDQAMTTYRHEVDRVLEELSESLRRVHRADEQMAEHLRRDDKAFLAAQEADLEQAPDDQPNVISGPEDIREVSQQVQESARAIDQVAGQLREIRLGIREGRMLPDDERIGSSDGFQRTWTEHFDDLREDLNHARKAGAEVADRLAEIDQNGARDVRRASRGGGGGQS